MKVSKYLIITKTGNITRMVNDVTRASVKWNEFAVEVVLDIPDSVFKRYFPTVEAKLTADSFVKPDPKVEVEEHDFEKDFKEVNVAVKAAKLSFTVDEVKEFVKTKRREEKTGRELDKMQEDMSKAFGGPQ
jgi:hypothetical protein